MDWIRERKDRECYQKAIETVQVRRAGREGRTCSGMKDWGSIKR